jgi:hypothetical protein
MSDNTSITVRQFAAVLKDWMVETINQELESHRQGAQQRGEELGTMLERSDANVAKKVRARRFREALAGLESTLVGQQEIEYRGVLDHVLHNIGASLHMLGLLAPESGLLDGPEFDFRGHSTFPAMVAPRRFIALPLVTRALGEMGFSRFWMAGASVYLTEYREWQPRFLRGPAHNDERYGLFVWSNLASRDVSFFPMSRVPGSRLVGNNELVMLGQRTSILSRLFDSTPYREQHVARLSARQFTRMLRALLLDYERLHTARQREVAEQDQLGAMLWDFLSREE